MDTPIRTAIHRLLGQRPTPTSRRKIAADLRRLADEQEQIADAEERSGHRLRPPPSPSATGRTGRPSGTGGRFVRWVNGGPGRSGTLHISAALWYEIGRPARLDIQRYGGKLVLRPAVAPDGWAVTRPTGAGGGNPRMNIGVENADSLSLIDGRIPAHVEGNAIVVEE